MRNSIAFLFCTGTTKYTGMHQRQERNPVISVLERVRNALGVARDPLLKQVLIHFEVIYYRRGRVVL